MVPNKFDPPYIIGPEIKSQSFIQGHQIFCQITATTCRLKMTMQKMSSIPKCFKSCQNYIRYQLRIFQR